MTTTSFPTWDIINPIRSFNFERNMFKLLHKRQISTTIKKFWEIDYLCIH